jgi:hypothetical protein
VPEWPNVTVVNALGDYGLAADRLAFIDGDGGCAVDFGRLDTECMYAEDPWLPATPHSPHAPERADTILRPFKLIRSTCGHRVFI